MIERDDNILATVTDEGRERRVALTIGRSLLHALQTAQVPIGSVCGGEMSCGTCHVYLDPPGIGGVQSADELCILEDDPAYRPGRSRLACQVAVTASLAGRIIEIASDD